MKTIKRADIKDCPKTAEYGQLSKDGTFIQMFYRVKDGVLQYQSEISGWHRSSFEDLDELGNLANIAKIE